MNRKDIAFWFLILIIIALSLYVLYWTKTEPYECVSNPYRYSMELLEKANGGAVYCTCSAPSGRFIFTKEGFEELKYETSIINR